MKRQRLFLSITFGALLLGLVLPDLGTRSGGPLLPRAAAASPFAYISPYEVWVIDQSDTRPDGGGTLYIYDGFQLPGRNAARAVPEVIDLGGEARERCLADTGTAPRRPHYLLFNPSQTHAIISRVASGHVLFMDAARRRVIGSIDVGVQAHAAVPSPDQRYEVVANQNGKLLQRIRTNYRTNSFVLEEAATLNLASGTTPSGAPREEPTLRPDNAPILALIESGSRFAFITLRGGGMFVVDITATPMKIVGEYDQSMVAGHGVVGVQASSKMYLNAGGGTANNPHQSDLYAFPIKAFSGSPNPPNTPAPRVVFSHNSEGAVDSHGITLVPGGRYLWVVDRSANRIHVVDTRTDNVVDGVSLAGELSADPAPDLLDTSPSGDFVFASLRGPTPLTGNAPGHDNAVGKTPGVAVIRIRQNGRTGVLRAIARIRHLVNGVDVADPHAIRVRLKGRR